MPTFHAIAQSTHADKRWKRYTSYAFAAKEALTPLVAQELPRAVLHLPIAFVRQDEQFMPAAMLGIQPGQNLFVAPDGRWLCGYTPAAYRAHPFALPMVYCQLLSMQHLPLLGQLAQAHRKAAQPLSAAPDGELDLRFLSNNGTLSFGAQ